MVPPGIHILNNLVVDHILLTSQISKQKTFMIPLLKHGLRPK